MNNRRKKVWIPTDVDEAYKRALKTALNIVGYKDNTEYSLREKLTERGYSAETVDSVTEYMKSKHFIDDGRMLISEARRLALSKLYGKARIKQELSLKHFDREALSSLDWENGELCDIDFSEVCTKLLQKRGGIKDEKTYAFLRRYGHSSSDIRTAYENLKNGAEDDGDEI